MRTLATNLDVPLRDGSSFDHLRGPKPRLVFHLISFLYQRRVGGICAAIVVSSSFFASVVSSHRTLTLSCRIVCNMETVRNKLLGMLIPCVFCCCFFTLRRTFGYGVRIYLLLYRICIYMDQILRSEKLVMPLDFAKGRM